jgi:copper(I)-binding protein
MKIVKVLTTALAIGMTLPPAAALAFDVQWTGAWMRPAVVGLASAMAYVDLTSDAPVDLIGAATPVARTVDIVVVSEDFKIAPKVVTALPLPANQMVRLAYRGSHLRLVDLTQTVNNGDTVPLTLTFKSAPGEVVRKTIDVQVRGLSLQPGPDGSPRRVELPPPPTDGPNQVPVPPPKK